MNLRLALKGRRSQNRKVKNGIWRVNRPNCDAASYAGTILFPFDGSFDGSFEPLPTPLHAN